MSKHVVWSLFHILYYLTMCDCAHLLKSFKTLSFLHLFFISFCWPCLLFVFSFPSLVFETNTCLLSMNCTWHIVRLIFVTHLHLLIISKYVSEQVLWEQQTKTFWSTRPKYVYSHFEKGRTKDWTKGTQLLKQKF